MYVLGELLLSVYLCRTFVIKLLLYVLGSCAPSTLHWITFWASALRLLFILDTSSYVFPRNYIYGLSYALNVENSDV